MPNEQEGVRTTRTRGVIEEAFRLRADGYARSDLHLRYAERLVELARPTSGMRVLDAATGTGFAAQAAASAVGPTGRAIGVDVSAEMLSKARQPLDSAGLPNVELVQADATALDQYPDASFVLVLCCAGLLNMPVRPALREWHRLLVDGGVVGFTTMREGYPVVGRLFRELARYFGLSLSDPATPLGDVARCGLVLRHLRPRYQGSTQVAVVACSRLGGQLITQEVLRHTRPSSGSVLGMKSPTSRF